MAEFIRIACGVPQLCLADPKQNAENICQQMAFAQEQKCDIVLFPELALTGYTCGDLFFQEALLDSVKQSLVTVLAASRECPEITAVIGLPVQLDGNLYNAAAVFAGGKVLGIAVKTFLPNYDCAAERRWFAPGSYLQRKSCCASALGLDENYEIPVGNDLVIPAAGTMIGVEICEDLWAPNPVSNALVLGGAEVILNPAASHELVGRRQMRRELVVRQSGAAKCIYAFCSAGAGESSQDLVYSGHSLIAQNGVLLQENKKLADTDYLLIQDADLGVIRSERSKNTTFRDAADYSVTGVHLCDGNEIEARSDGSLYPVSQNPFLPEEPEKCRQWCLDMFQIQAAGLKQRLSKIGANAVIGVSGGLDSTLALLVAVEAFRQMDKPMQNLYGVTLPCFGTSDRTYENALTLMKTLGISTKEINIRDAVTTHFRDIGHDVNVHNGTYENSQARERTQILMDYASVVNGIVIGTGDLSELALGWCTYNGDHMSMYSVNASIPKTVIQKIVAAVANHPDYAAVKEVLLDILDTPISPELLPPDQQGAIAQQTEDIVGPYALHDFFLYYILRYSFSPKKIYALACKAFQGVYDGKTILKWLRVCYRRFFTQQFKRNCMPDGVRVGDVSLSPRGDWQMPSDASGRIWLEELDTIEIGE